MSHASSVILKTNCGQLIETVIPVARGSGLVATMLDDIKEGEDVVVPLPNVDAPTLRIVLEFLKLYEHAGDDARAALSVATSDAIPILGGFPAWIRDFEIPADMLGDVFIAASYMDVTPLEKLVLAKLVARMRELTPEDVRAEVVKVSAPFTEEEEWKVRGEHVDVIEGNVAT